MAASQHLTIDPTAFSGEAEDAPVARQENEGEGYPVGLELVPFDGTEIDELGRICHLAFSSLHDRHAVARDIPDVATGVMIMGLLAARVGKDVAGIVARRDGRVIGSNFIFFADPVAGVGPITVEPGQQSGGVGRALMQWAIDEVGRRGCAETRLFQEAINTTSLSLYTALGFHWREAAALMRIAPAPADDPTIRPWSIADLPAIEALSQASYGFTRAGDAAELLAAGLPGFIREQAGAAVGFYVPSLFGFAGAHGDDDLLALVAHAGRHVPPPMAQFICPLGRPGLFARALVAGHRTVKVLNYMSLERYTPPPGAYLPSISC